MLPRSQRAVDFVARSGFPSDGCETGEEGFLVQGRSFWRWCHGPSLFEREAGGSSRPGLGRKGLLEAERGGLWRSWDPVIFGIVALTLSLTRVNESSAKAQ